MRHERQGTEIAVRRMREEDVGAVAGILRAAVEAANWTEASLRDCLGWPEAIALVSESGGAMSGFLIGRLVLEEAEILNIAVLPEKRRRGEGSMLFAAALEEFGRREVRRVFLEVRETNEGAIALYKKHGFSAMDRRPRYYKNPDEAALVMEKKLAD